MMNIQGELRVYNQSTNTQMLNTQSSTKLVPGLDLNSVADLKSRNQYNYTTQQVSGRDGSVIQSKASPTNVARHRVDDLYLAACFRLPQQPMGPNKIVSRQKRTIRNDMAKTQ